MEQKQWEREWFIAVKKLQYQEKWKATPPKLVEAGMFHGMQWNALMVFSFYWELWGNPFNAHAQVSTVLVSEGDKTMK